MTAASSPTPLLHLVVGYDGSPPASRALDAAALLLQGRTGRIAVVYIAHLSGIVVEAPVAAAETEPGFDQIEQELRAQAADQLRDRGAPWEFERRQGNIGEELGTVAADIGKANPGEFVMIVVWELILADPPRRRFRRGRPGPPPPGARPDRAIGRLRKGLMGGQWKAGGALSLAIAAVGLEPMKSRCPFPSSPARHPVLVASAVRSGSAGLPELTSRYRRAGSFKSPRTSSARS